MASLYDRLNRIKPADSQTDKAAVKPDLLIETKTYNLELPEGVFSGDVLASLTNGQINQDIKPEQLLFFDTETTGLSRGAGTIAFLIGFGQFVNGQLQITQVLMRDYPQEAQLLKEFIARLAPDSLLVSYNGASFDLPLLEGRLIMNRLRVSLTDYAHLDLLHAARKVYKLRLGRVPLTRIEEAIFGIFREDDLPGSQIPARYFNFLQSQDERLLRDILDHNREDIHSLARLYLRLASLHHSPLLSEHQQDVYSLGRMYERQGQTERAILCYRACSDLDVQGMARLRLGELYRKHKQDEAAVDAFELLRSQGMHSPRVFISLAKIYEHRYRDPARALEIARQGMLYCVERLGNRASLHPDYLDLERRSQRLMRKAERQT